MLRPSLKFVVLYACLTFVGCSQADDPSSQASPASESAATSKEGDEMTVTGTVTARVQDGIDGSVYSIKTENGNSINVLLSIPNLGEEGSKGLADVEEGVVVEVSGEMVDLGDSQHLVAKSLRIRD